MSGKTDKECIEHDGIVQDSGNNHVTVRILSASACSGCHSSGSCTLAGMEEKLIDVNGTYNVAPGDKVIIQMKQSAGFLALFLGYIMPLLVVMALLIILVSVSVPELTAGLCSIAVLVPYYLVLRLFRKQIGEKFTFTIKA